MGKPSPPKAPDPTATINAQEQANSQSALQTAELNRISQNTPYGSINYSISGYNADGTPQYVQNQSLSPVEQQLFNLGTQGQVGLANTALNVLPQVQGAFANQISPSSLPGIASKAAPTAGAPGITGQIGSGDYAAQIKQAQDAAYNAQAQYLDPRFAQAHEATDNSLINQGITQGSHAYDVAQQNLGLQQNQAYQQAQDAAVAAGNVEQNTLFGQQAQQAQFQNAANLQGFNQGLANAGLQNQANQQALQQGLTLQNEPLNQFSALASGSQVSQPNFQSFATPQVANTDVGGIINQGYQNQLAGYNAQLAASPLNALFSLGGSLGSAAIMAG